MHLKRFNEFVRELCTDPSLCGSADAIEVARRFQGTWYRDDGSQIGDDRLIKNLELTIKQDRPWRRPNECRAFFPVKEFDAVVVMLFQAKPTSGTRQRLHDCIISCLKRCSDSYGAQHDALTALLNRRAFDTILTDTLDEFQTPMAVPDEEEAQERSGYSSIILLTLDIDFFKRVNDNYGHLYGDVALKSFAIRLERACESLASQHEAKVYCARPSGEEFAVLLAGNMGLDDELGIAERLRQAIASEPLPGDGELSVMAGEPRLQQVAMPPITERQITTSVGLASRHSAAAPDPTDAIAERMKVEADLSLYRAKALGRNRCVRFCDIVQRHGQVIEHHSNVDVVAIDLGQQVGVSVGQEFLVFHPDFIGSKPFIFGDGRSERKLGSYPRVPHGRLEVFDVQLEISFAYVAEKRGIDRFPVGALLEAVPVGSIAHLVHKDWWRWRDLQALAPTQEDLEQELLKVDPWDTAGVACLALSNRERLLGSRGAGLVNRIYAALYNELRETFRRELVAQIRSDTFAIVLRYDASDLKDRFERISERIEQSYDSLPFVSVGLFSQPPPDSGDDNNKKQFNIDFKHGLICAQAALILGVKRTQRVTYFAYDTASELLMVLRMNKEHDSFYMHYQQFQHIDIVSGSMENQVALTAFARKDYPAALDAIDRALAIEPDRHIFKLNKGLFLVAAQRMDDADEVFATAPARKGEHDMYKTARTMAEYHRYRSNIGQINRQQLIKSLSEIQNSRSLPLLGIRPFDVTLALLNVKSRAETVTES